MVHGITFHCGSVSILLSNPNCGIQRVFASQAVTTSTRLSETPARYQPETGATSRNVVTMIGVREEVEVNGGKFGEVVVEKKGACPLVYTRQTFQAFQVHFDRLHPSRHAETD